MRSDLQRIAHRAMLDRGLLPDFSAAEIAEAQHLDPGIGPADPETRDLRGLLWASIDNDDSRDLDQLTVVNGTRRNQQSENRDRAPRKSTHAYLSEHVRICRIKNAHAVALGHLGGRKGGLARARSLSRRRRSEIASLAGTARAKALPATKRQELARRAALARWARRSAILTAQDAPESVRRLLKTYDPAALAWNKPDDRYAVVREILVRGSDEAKGWLRGVLGPRQVRELVRDYRGAGCTEPERQKLRDDLGLTSEDLPVRPYLGFQWRRPE
jgi:hypothetical protein